MNDLKFEELNSIKEEKGISLYLSITPNIGKKEILSTSKKLIESIKDKFENEEKDYFEKSKDNLLNYIEGLRVKGRSLFLFSTPKNVYEFFYEFPLRNEIIFGKPNFYQFYWAQIENPPFGVVNFKEDKFSFYKVIFLKERLIFEEHPKIDTSTWRRKHIMPPSAPKSGVSIGAVGGGDLKDAYEEKYLLYIEKYLSEYKERVLKISFDLNFIFVNSDAEENIDMFLNIEPKSNKFVKLNAPSNATINEIISMGIMKLEEFKKLDEKEILKNLFDRSATSNLAGVGLSSTLKVLQDGRVNKLIVSENINNLIKECKNCGYFYIERESCPICNSNEYENINIRHIVHDLSKKFKSELVILHGGESKELDKHEGIGGLWRY
jgi:predicted nucleic-acid-binding Zn-ribbon protein